MRINRRTRRTTLALAAALALPAAASGQAFTQEGGDLVDRVVAVVGDSVVLLSQIQTDLQQMQLQGRQLPTDPAALQQLFEQSLEEWVNRVLILQAAARDSLIQIDEQQVEASVQQEIDRRTEAFGGQPQLQQALAQEGLTLASYRDILSNQIRQEQIQQMYMRRQLRDASPVIVDEAELREAFQEASAQLQQRPRLVSFDQVVVAPAPSDSADALALAKAQAILDSIQAGRPFEELAQAHSNDPGSAPNGGDLDWFRRGTMVREFEDAAFGLRDGQVSQPVKTEFGYHIIKIERSRPGERKGRHILIIPAQTSADADQAMAVAEEVAEQARAGVPMGELYDRYSDQEAPDTLTVTFEQLDQLPPGYDQIRNASEGDVVGPIRYQAARGDTRMAVVRIREIREAGAWTFDEVRAQLEDRIIQQKQIERIVAGLKERTHIDIRM